MLRFLLSATVIALLTSGAAATVTTAPHAFILDIGNGTVLLEKDADTPIPPASMSKLMTIEVVFQALADGRLKLDDTFEVSRKAWKTGGSKMFVRVGTLVRVEDLLRGIIVSSGNDACVVIAEGFDGSEAAFATRLNQRAVALGLTGSHFTNASGWPDPEHRMTVRDIALLSAHIIRTYPQFYPMFAETTFTWERVKQPNRNPVLGRVDGADGLKTGHTRESGYGLAASATRGGRRVLAVISGLESARARTTESRRLLEWAFREFREGAFFSAGEIVGAADVWFGEQAQVAVAAGADIRGMMRISAGNATARLRMVEPVPAPIIKGQPLGTLEVETPDGALYSAPLVAAKPVAAAGFRTRLIILLEQLLRRPAVE